MSGNPRARTGAAPLIGDRIEALGVPVPRRIDLTAGPPLRVGLVAPPWLPVPPDRYGGTEGVIDRLARGLVEAGHRVFLWTTGDSTCPVEKDWVVDSTDGIPIGSSAVELRHVWAGYEWLERQQVDVIHDHTFLGPALARSMDTAPVVTTNHGPFTDVDLADVYRRLAPTVPVLAISRDQAAAGAAVGVDIAAVIHHGVDLEAFPVGAGRGDDRGDYLLFLGRMSPDKGAHRAIRVARRAGRRLLIAAKMREKAEHDYFRRRVEPGLGDGIEYLGEVDQQEKLRLLGGAAALVNPIRWPEPFGLVMIEALACGTPVLTFPEGAAPEIVDDGVTGFVCADLDAMVRAVDRLDGIDRTACRAAVEERFSTARMVDEHVRFYRSVLARSRPVPPPLTAVPPAVAATGGP